MSDYLIVEADLAMPKRKRTLFGKFVLFVFIVFNVTMAIAYFGVGDVLDDTADSMQSHLEEWSTPEGKAQLKKQLEDLIKEGQQIHEQYGKPEDGPLPEFNQQEFDEMFSKVVDKTPEQRQKIVDVLSSSAPAVRSAFGKMWLVGGIFLALLTFLTAPRE